MNMNNIVQTFKTVVDDFNLVDRQNRGLHLDYHIFSGVAKCCYLQSRNYNIGNSRTSISSLLHPTV